MSKYNKKFAAWVTNKAKDTSFIDCEIEGLKNEGERTQVFGTKIFNFRKDHPSIWWSGLFAIIAGIIAGVALLVIEYKFFV
ncbi:MAG: hypothetical protein WCT33_05280 [Patescibacteria group bacterium]|jgi:hypothetical protein